MIGAPAVLFYALSNRCRLDEEMRGQNHLRLSGPSGLKSTSNGDGLQEVYTWPSWRTTLVVA